MNGMNGYVDEVGCHEGGRGHGCPTQRGRGGRCWALHLRDGWTIGVHIELGGQDCIASHRIALYRFGQGICRPWKQKASIAVLSTTRGGSLAYGGRRVEANSGARSCKRRDVQVASVSASSSNHRPHLPLHLRHHPPPPTHWSVTGPARRGLHTAPWALAACASLRTSVPSVSVRPCHSRHHPHPHPHPPPTPSYTYRLHPPHRALRLSSAQ